RHHGDAATLTFGGRALHALLRDKRPDLIQVEEEPTVPAARQVVRAARQLKLPAVLFTHQNVAVPLPWLGGWRRNRTLRRLRGAIAGSEGAAALVRGLVPGLRVGVIPQLGVHVPTEPQHEYHDGLAIGCVGRLVPEKGIDTLLQALAENRAHRWHLTVVGDGPDRERLQRLASAPRVAGRTPAAPAAPGRGRHPPPSGASDARGSRPAPATKYRFLSPGPNGRRIRSPGPRDARARARSARGRRAAGSRRLGGPARPRAPARPRPRSRRSLRAAGATYGCGASRRARAGGAPRSDA